MKTSRFIFLAMLLGALGYTIARLIFLLTYGGDTVWADFGNILETLFWGVRLDLRVFAILLALPFLGALAGLIMPLKIGQKMAVFVRIYTQWIFTLALMFAIINHYYYNNFQNHIDIFLFEILDLENALPVFKTMASDYPLFPAILAVLVMHWLFGKLLLWISYSDFGHQEISSIAFKSFFVLGSLAVMVLLIRGSVGTFPLTLNRISIAGDIFLNRAVANGAIAFADAVTDWRQMKGVPVVSDDEALHAYITYFGEAPADGKVDLDDLLQVPPAAPEIEKPNVIAVQMESFGGQILDLHDTEKNNLLGSLEKNIKQDYLFNAFASSTRGTLGSIEKLLLNSGMGNISKGKYRKVPLRFAVARMFKQQGYETVFITSGRKTWARLDNLLPNQGFDRIIDGRDIQQAMPGAEDDGTWGVYDEYSFKYLYQMLKSHTGKPLFVYVLTVTNHSPYALPDDFHPLPVEVPDFMRGKVLHGDMKKATLVLQSYQYASNALGEFVNSLKADDKLRDRTLLAATGDHFMRDIFNYGTDSADVAHRYRVPLYLYLPEKYTRGTVKDGRRIGSHRDIFTTLFRRALPNAPYFRLGNDLLSKDYDADRALGICVNFAMSKAGCVVDQEGRTSFYTWKDRVAGDVIPVSGKPDPALQAVHARYNAYQTLMRWQMYKQLGKP